MLLVGVFPMSELVLCWVEGSLSGGKINSSSSRWSSSAISATWSAAVLTTLTLLVAGGREGGREGGEGGGEREGGRERE